MTALKIARFNATFGLVMFFIAGVFSIIARYAGTEAAEDSFAIAAILGGANWLLSGFLARRLARTDPPVTGQRRKSESMLSEGQNDRPQAEKDTQRAVRRMLRLWLILRKRPLRRFAACR